MLSLTKAILGISIFPFHAVEKECWTINSHPLNSSSYKNRELLKTKKTKKFVKYNHQ